jgi:Domain of unknown function (DUF1707)
VATQPWVPAPGSAGRGRLRAADADRDQVIDTLKTAFVEGRLTKDELDMRAGHALASRTYAELIAITADIPGRQLELPPLRLAPAQARKPVSKKVLAWSTCAVVVPPALGAVFLTYYGGFLVLFLFAFIGLTLTTGPSHRDMGT